MKDTDSTPGVHPRAYLAPSDVALALGPCPRGCTVQGRPVYLDPSSDAYGVTVDECPRCGFSRPMSRRVPRARDARPEAVAARARLAAEDAAHDAADAARLAAAGVALAQLHAAHTSEVQSANARAARMAGCGRGVLTPEFCRTVGGLVDGVEQLSHAGAADRFGVSLATINRALVVARGPETDAERAERAARRVAARGREDAASRAASRKAGRSRDGLMERAAAAAVGVTDPSHPARLALVAACELSIATRARRRVRDRAAYRAGRLSADRPATLAGSIAPALPRSTDHQKAA